MNEKATEALIELIDLGDAMAETKQVNPTPLVPDSWFQYGWCSNPINCPR